MSGRRLFFRQRGAQFFPTGKIKKPQVCIDYRGEANASFSIKDCEITGINGKIPSTVIKKVKNKLLQNQKFLLGSWQNNLYGLVADLNFRFGGINTIMVDKDCRLNDLYGGREILGSISLMGVSIENISMDTLNYFLREFCNNYRKIEIIKRICILKQCGVTDTQILLVKNLQIFL